MFSAGKVGIVSDVKSAKTDLTEPVMNEDGELVLPDDGEVICLSDDCYGGEIVPSVDDASHAFVHPLMRNYGDDDDVYPFDAMKQKIESIPCMKDEVSKSLAIEDVAKKIRSSQSMSAEDAAGMLYRLIDLCSEIKDVRNMMDVFTALSGAILESTSRPDRQILLREMFASAGKEFNLLHLVFLLRTPMSKLSLGMDAESANDFLTALTETFGKQSKSVVFYPAAERAVQACFEFKFVDGGIKLLRSCLEFAKDRGDFESLRYESLLHLLKELSNPAKPERTAQVIKEIAVMASTIESPELRVLFRYGLMERALGIEDNELVRELGTPALEDLEKLEKGGLASVEYSAMIASQLARAGLSGEAMSALRIMQRNLGEVRQSNVFNMSFNSVKRALTTVAETDGFDTKELLEIIFMISDVLVKNPVSGESAAVFLSDMSVALVYSRDHKVLSQLRDRALRAVGGLHGERDYFVFINCAKGYTESGFPLTAFETLEKGVAYLEKKMNSASDADILNFAYGLAPLAYEKDPSILFERLIALAKSRNSLALVEAIEGFYATASTNYWHKQAEN